MSVARLAGVSKMTVSRVLAGHSVAADTRTRRQAIDQLGYVADAAAGALSSGRSEFVAVLVPSLSSSNFSDTVRGLTDALEPHGLQLLLGDTDYDLEREERLVRSMLRHQPRCVALTGAQHTDATRKVLERSAIPVVEMWDLPTHPIDTAVGFSNVRAARAMVWHLAERGYRRIGFRRRQRTGSPWPRPAQGIPGGNQGAAVGRAAHRAARRIADHHEPRRACDGGLLAQWPDTDAVMCVSDMSAFGAIMECHRRGLSVPEDIAVAGFGNFEVATCCHPAITTVSVDAYGIGLRTGEALLAALQARDGGEPVDSQSIRIDYTIVARESA